jgi:O-methyltransferase involved in polyketide biosynthesis
MQVSRTTHQAGLYRALGSRQGGLATRGAQLRTPRAVWFGYAEPKAPDRAALARTRFIEDQLRAAAADGIAQVVWLGTEYPCPLPELVPIQLGEDELVGLARPSADPGALEMALASRGLDAAKRCIFVWDGMLERLDAASVQRVLSSIGRACPSSRFAFTYLHRGLLDGSVRFDVSQKPLHAVPRLGNATQFGLDPRDVPAFLSQLGLVLDSDLSTDEYARRSEHAQSRAARRGVLRGCGFYRLACAHVIGRP